MSDTGRANRSEAPSKFGPAFRALPFPRHRSSRRNEQSPCCLLPAHEGVLICFSTPMITSLGLISPPAPGRTGRSNHFGRRERNAFTSTISLPGAHINRAWFRSETLGRTIMGGIRVPAGKLLSICEESNSERQHFL